MSWRIRPCRPRKHRALPVHASHGLPGWRNRGSPINVDRARPRHLAIALRHLDEERGDPVGRGLQLHLRSHDILMRLIGITLNPDRTVDSTEGENPGITCAADFSQWHFPPSLRRIDDEVSRLRSLQQQFNPIGVTRCLRAKVHRIFFDLRDAVHRRIKREAERGDDARRPG